MGNKVRVIKRYNNRKLYDLATSKYVTLYDIVAMVRNNEDLMVIANETRNDVTKDTLLTALLLLNKENKTSITIPTIREYLK